MSQKQASLLTKIIATVGPACDRPDILARMIREGVRVFRINFSHGDIPQFEKAIQAIREAEAQLDASPHVGILGDISGPKIRVGKVVDEGIHLNPRDEIYLSRSEFVAGSPGAPPNTFSTTLPNVISDVESGHRLLINDGAIRTKVIDKVRRGNDEVITCRVEIGGLVTSGKGINLPDTDLRVSAITKRDWECIDWAIDADIDFLALSFVRCAADIRELKDYLRNKNPNRVLQIPIVAKIEKPQAVDDIENIVKVTNGIMVARGDLGVEMNLTEVPMIQKRIIRTCHEFGKPVIVATQMLQSMIDSPMPTRAEVSDVANAILDGADSVMLSGETAIGRNPVEAVRIMAATAMATQRGRFRSEIPTSHPRNRETRYRTAALARGVKTIVDEVGAKLIVVWSQLGRGAHYLSQNRPHIPVIAASSNDVALRQMSMVYALHAIEMQTPDNISTFRQDVDRLLVRNGWAEPGDSIVIVAGEPIGTPGVTNSVMIHYVGDK